MKVNLGFWWRAEICNDEPFYIENKQAATEGNDGNSWAKVEPNPAQATIEDHVGAIHSNIE